MKRGRENGNQWFAFTKNSLEFDRCPGLTFCTHRGMVSRVLRKFEILDSKQREIKPRVIYTPDYCVVPLAPPSPIRAQTANGVRHVNVVPRRPSTVASGFSRFRNCSAKAIKHRNRRFVHKPFHYRERKRPASNLKRAPKHPYCRGSKPVSFSDNDIPKKNQGGMKDEETRILNLPPNTFVLK